MNIPNDWTFDSQEVVDNFDSHVREQLPWYDMVTQAIVTYARAYIPPSGLMYDLGCSTGNVSSAVHKALGKRYFECISIDNSQEMVDNFMGYGDVEFGTIVDYPMESCDFAVCFLTLMFIPKKYRKHTINKIMQSIDSGGALLIVEKFLPESSYPATIASKMTNICKINAGASLEDAMLKEVSLIGNQRPLSLDELPAGAYEFFRFSDFRGYIIEGAYK